MAARPPAAAAASGGGNAPRFSANPARRAMLAKVHLAAKELGMPRDDYEALLERVTGRRSAGGLSQQQLADVLAEFGRLGWVARGAQPPPGSRARPADHPAARKARAMWISLYHLGAVRKASEQALEAFARRQLGVERLQWADQSQTYRLTEALKAMAERAGWAQGNLPPGLEARTLVCRLIERLQALLEEIDPDAPAIDVRTAYPACGRGWPKWPIDQLYGLARTLGQELSAARARRDQDGSAAA